MGRVAVEHSYKSLAQSYGIHDRLVPCTTSLDSQVFIPPLIVFEVRPKSPYTDQLRPHPYNDYEVQLPILIVKVRYAFQYLAKLTAFLLSQW